MEVKVYNMNSVGLVGFEIFATDFFKYVWDAGMQSNFYHLFKLPRVHYLQFNRAQ